MIKNLIEKIRTYAKEGLFHIFGSKMVAQVASLISSVVVIRHLEKVDYGSYVNAVNLYTYPAVFAGLGMSNVIIQYCSEKISDGRKSAIYRHSLWSGNVANVAVAVVIAAMAYWRYCIGDSKTAFYLLLMCGLPFINYADTYAQTVLRVKGKNKVFSNANTVYSIVLLVGNVILTRLFDVPGLVWSRYVAYFVATIICMSALWKERFFRGIYSDKERLEPAYRRQINNYGAICAITNFSTTVLTLLDVTCLDLVMKDATVLADYHVASVIPSACAFVPSCLMVYFYPKLVAAISDGKAAGRKYLFQLAKVYAVVNGIVFLGIAICAPVLIWIVYGEKYMNVIGLMQILNVNYLATCIRNLMGNTIAAIKKVKMNLLFAVISGVLNIVLNVLLIPWLGASGAAIATVIVTLSVAAMDCGYVLHYFRKEE